MLNFYNYYGKIHPELASRLEELDRKMNLLDHGSTDTLIIRVGNNFENEDENMFAKGDVIFKDSFGAGDTIKLSEEESLHILRDIKVIMVYRNYYCHLLYKTWSNARSGVAAFGKEEDGISLENNTLTRKLPS